MTRPTPTAVLEASQPIASTPAGVYLAVHRELPAPPPDINDLVRWLPGKTSGLKWDNGRDIIPGSYAGAVCYFFRNQITNQLQLCELDMLFPDGTRPPKRKQYSFGTKVNSYFGWVRQREPVLHIAEGPLDAWQIKSKFPTHNAIAVGGTAGTVDVICITDWLVETSMFVRKSFPWDISVVIHSDGDGAGQQAAVKLRDEITQYYPTRIVWYPQGHDPASWLTTDAHIAELGLK